MSEELQNEPLAEEATKAQNHSEEPQIFDKEKFLKEFNWENYEEGIESVDQSKLSEFEELVKSNFVNTEDKKIASGVVVRITERDAIVDIHAKSEGVISLNEFRYNPDLKVGDLVDVVIDTREDKTGQLVLSHKKARAIKSWERILNAYESGEIINGFVKWRTKGGMIVDVLGIEAFLPGSQIDVKPVRDYDQYVGKTMEFKVVKVNHKFKNIVVSHKALIEADIASQKREIMGQLEKGQVLEGIVKNMTNYGVFIDLGGVDGLVHITDISWNRVTSPSEVLQLDQKVRVVILDFDESKSRIQLGIKQLETHPWDSLDKNLKEGDKIKGVVTVITDYGAFVEVSKSVEGLVHVSEMSWSTHLRSAQDFVKVGSEVDAVILSLDRESKKMSLGMKQLTPDPWTDITTKYPVGSRHTGLVRNFTNFGAFVELEEGVDGLVYISDLSWTKKVKHPSDFVQVGEKIDVIVLELDVQARKLSLSHKQTQENPWDQLEDEFAVGTLHDGEITKFVDKGAIAYINEFVSAFVPSRFLNKEDGSKLKVGEKAKFKIIEFSKEFRKVLASHTSTFKEEENNKPSNNSNNNSSRYQQRERSETERSTLGDYGALADLKEQMDRRKK